MPADLHEWLRSQVDLAGVAESRVGKKTKCGVREPRLKPLHASEELQSIRGLNTDGVQKITLLTHQLH